jgi:hypothetical protein
LWNQGVQTESTRKWRKGRKKEIQKEKRAHKRCAEEETEKEAKKERRTQKRKEKAPTDIQRRADGTIVEDTEKVIEEIHMQRNRGID